MKSILIILFTAFSSFYFSQAYQPIVDMNNPNQNKSWIDLQMCGTFGGPSCRDIDYKSYNMEGDTLINGLTYRKLYGAIFSYNENGIQGFCQSYYYTISSYKYKGAIRESSKKVYFKDTVNAEILIYDFNLGVGDTVPDMGFISNSVISSIDSVFINTVFHKRFEIHTQSLPPYEITEGIGSSSGFLQHFHGGISCNNFLACASENNLALMGTSDTCDVRFNYAQSVQGISEKNIANSIKVFPNPVRTGQKIHIKRENEMPAIIFITDLTGKTVYTSEIYSTEYELLVDLLPGIYFLHSNNYLQTKIMVTN